MYKMTLEHRGKIGAANKRGRFEKCFVCLKDFWLQPYQEKSGKKCCSSKCFAIRYKNVFAKHGDKNIFWKNGGWSYIKRQALKRDNHTCQKCGFSDKEIMEVDHIKERILGGKSTLENVQTLCPNCHARKTVNFLKNRIIKPTPMLKWHKQAGFHGKTP